ncbi:ArsR/SmtB family transcription factor [Nocardioides daejeonensis]|uniref:ArsR/SmtB family transcription factor n=1 Tax=Nocardioides daejeonensis TaxID=1046556 RepID=UPI000D744117|nr:helix-turn-helix domain-containing protein [Nocardioides daejeonensis]
MTSIETLRAVLHPARRRIVHHLYLYGPTQVGTLARELGQQVGSISHHLRMLERVGVVVPAPELATDGRTSWWRLVRESFSWSADDFADSPADHMQAKAAERVNLEHHTDRWVAWKRQEAAVPAAWRRAAFSVDLVAQATPEELAGLQEALLEAWRAWREGIDTDDGQRRQPVFAFAYGFPSRP